MKKLKQLWTVNLRLKTFSLRPGIHTYSDIFEKGDFFPCFQKKYASTRSVCESFSPVHTKTLKRRKYNRIPYEIYVMLEAHEKREVGVFKILYCREPFFFEKMRFR